MFNIKNSNYTRKKDFLIFTLLIKIFEKKNTNQDLLNLKIGNIVHNMYPSDNKLKTEVWKMT